MVQIIPSLAVLNAFLPYIFISHMVQIIRRCECTITRDFANFISHMVQIIHIFFPSPLQTLTNFISHMVQIIHGDFFFRVDHLPVLYIPHGSDNTMWLSDIINAPQLFISHMVQIILGNLYKNATTPHKTLYPTWFR